jgi:hypothetical protein
MLLLTAAALLCVGVATAQELPRFDSGELDLPPDDFTLMPSEPASPMESPGTTEESMVVGPVESAVDSLEGCDPSSASAYDLWDMEPVPIESTGTWLRRGLWYAEAEAVVMMRLWSRQDVLLASANGFPPPFSDPNIFIMLRQAHPGQDASVRTTLGRYLFRDIDNRDHTTELTIFVGGDWVQNLEAGSPNVGLQVPFLVDGNNTSFDDSLRQTAIYSSRFNSFEWNYRVQRRLTRDQMVMDPNGQWTRQASSGFTKEFLVGLRFLELTEILDWKAEDVQVNGNDGSYLIQSDNDLVGMQLGSGFTFETSRWSIGLSGKGGAYVNDASSTQQLDFTLNNAADYQRDASEDQLSFIGDLTPNFSLRSGLHVLYITSVAQAPNQANFIADFKNVVTSGDPFYFGVSAGFEGYW